MKSHRKFFYDKKRYFLNLALLIICFSILFFFYTQKDPIAFHHFLKQFTTQQLESNALDLHYTLQNPDIYDIECMAVLPTYKSGDALNAYKGYEEDLQALTRIDISNLSSKDAFVYNVLYDYLQENMELAAFTYYEEPLAPNSGMHTTLPILLAEYQFYSKKDIQTYLSLLSTLPDYLNSLALYESEKANAGLFMNSASLNQVVLACREFASTNDVTSHLLYCSFSERLETLTFLEESEKNAYIEENKLLLTESVFPAYKSLADQLTQLSVYCNENYHGLCSYDNGKQYYEALVRRNTGSYRSIQEIKEFLFSSFEDSYLNLISLLSSNPVLLENNTLSSFHLAFPLKDANEILNHLQLSMYDDFPILNTKTQIDVKNVSESLEDYCAPAFYLTVPLDNYENNVIYLNQKNPLIGLNLYTTLAHEGFPGHLYQTVFFHETNAKNYASPSYTSLLRNLLYFGGYVEGYALYVESLSYEYAKSACNDSNVSYSDIICDVLKYEWKMQISLYCLLDIAIHYDGATYTQVKALLNKFGIMDENSCINIYQYLLAEPTNYLQYYLGYLEIEDLKQKALCIWGTDYSDLRFHTFFLEAGPCNFNRLEEILLKDSSD